jgi:hypothetical protein
MAAKKHFIMPEGVNQIAFYQAARAKGIRVSSRFVGVSINTANREITWTARIQSKGKLVKCKDFPLTEEGEREAGAYYKRHKSPLNGTENT